MNCNVNCGFLVIVMCEYRFISCNKCVTLLGDVDSGGSLHVRWVRVYMENFFIPSAQFCFEPKLL